MGLQERTAKRRQRIQTHKAKDYADAERWDLEFWQSQSPEERLSALVAIRNDIKKTEAARSPQEK